MEGHFWRRGWKVPGNWRTLSRAPKRLYGAGSAQWKPISSRSGRGMGRAGVSVDSGSRWKSRRGRRGGGLVQDSRGPIDKKGAKNVFSPLQRDGALSNCFCSRGPRIPLRANKLGFSNHDRVLLSSLSRLLQMPSHHESCSGVLLVLGPSPVCL